MTRPTAEQIRAEPAGRRLDAWIAVYITKTFTDGLLRMIAAEPEGNSVLNDGEDGDGPYKGMLSHYSTDPAACAELRRHLLKDGKYDFVSHCSDDCRGNRRYMVHLEWDGDKGYTFVEHSEPISTDPIAAECLAWCKAALLSAAASPDPV